MAVLNFLEDKGDLYVNCSDLIDFLTDIINNTRLYSETDRKLATEIKEGLIRSMTRR
jgi:hypothetical protein